MKISLKGIIHDIILFQLGTIWILFNLRDKRVTSNIFEKIRMIKGIEKKIESKRDVIIVHSSSLGETKNALLFSKYLKSRLSIQNSFDIKNTVFTDTAKSLFKETYLLPLPFYITMRNFLPENLKLVIFYEGDLWPGYIISAKEKGAKILVVSGKISERSVKIIKKTPLPYILSNIDSVFAASEDYAERFKEIGIKNVVSSIDLKNLIFLENENKFTNGERAEETNKSKKLKKIKKGIIGISTRGNEEVEFLIETQKILGDDYSLFIAPRHNFDDVKSFLSSKNIKFVSFSDMQKQKQKQKNQNNEIEELMEEIASGRGKNQVFIIDAYGVVDKILDYFHFAFVGGSILPLGGHNVLEPISRGILVATGKHIWNIPEREELIKERVLFIVDSPKELAELIKKSKKEDIERVKKFVSKKKNEVLYEMNRILDEINRRLLN
ncbi:MAG: glycosyltransferase N-terminal domain-containing protein [Candidatus Calescibacterium sp.]|jgi:3-deoxy-D-manno-octulosonic-acid transferase|nr:glycosyltransferase N-terminal domain-containing protein [Candidatus Calescibacterium sp.]